MYIGDVDKNVRLPTGTKNIKGGEKKNLRKAVLMEEEGRIWLYRTT
jgi:hypothetical protein